MAAERRQGLVRRRVFDDPQLSRMDAGQCRAFGGMSVPASLVLSINGDAVPGCLPDDGWFFCCGDGFGHKFS